jgi:hypothetical protein
MCAAVVAVVRFVNVRSMVRSCVAVSSVTVVKPVPGVLTAGLSFAPDRGALNVMVAPQLTPASPVTDHKIASALACFLNIPLLRFRWFGVVSSA